MANPIGVQVAGTEITEKHVYINRENPKIMSIEKAMGNFCKILLLGKNRQAFNRTYGRNSVIKYFTFMGTKKKIKKN